MTRNTTTKSEISAALTDNFDHLSRAAVTVADLVLDEYTPEGENQILQLLVSDVNLDEYRALEEDSEHERQYTDPDRVHCENRSSLVDEWVSQLRGAGFAVVEADAEESEQMVSA